MLPVMLKSRKAKPNLDYNWIEEDKQKLIQYFQNSPVCFVRAADAELRILQGHRKLTPKKTPNASQQFRMVLARTLERSNLIGLPRNYINLNHPEGWDKEIRNECKKLGITIINNPAQIVSTFIFYHAPELLSQLINYKKVLWINYNAQLFPELLKLSNYCNYYGFKYIKSSYINIPDGKAGWIFESSMDQVIKDVCTKLSQFDFDIAVVGAGAMANIICMYIRDVLRKSAIDAGAILSALRGQVNRGTFKRNNKNACLVWRDNGK